MDDDYVVTFELSLLASNIKKEVCGVLDYFISFQKWYEESKTHNMFLLMLAPWFKSFCLVSPFVGHEQGISMIEKYDKKSL